MGFANSVVGVVLRSPAHRLLSGSTDLLAYEGRQSGRRIVLPTQYARSGDDVVVLVGRPETKRWWCNFVEPRDLDVLLAGEWHAMTGQVVRGELVDISGRRDSDGDYHVKARYRFVPPEGGEALTKTQSAQPCTGSAQSAPWAMPSMRSCAS